MTNAAMDGNMDLAQSIEARMRLMDPTPEDIRAFLKQHDPESRLVPGAKVRLQLCIPCSDRPRQAMTNSTACCLPSCRLLHCFLEVRQSSVRV